jgi:hypothetical protein
MAVISTATAVTLSTRTLSALNVDIATLGGRCAVPTGNSPGSGPSTRKNAFLSDQLFDTSSIELTGGSDQAGSSSARSVFTISEGAMFDCEEEKGAYSQSIVKCIRCDFRYETGGIRDARGKARVHVKDTGHICTIDHTRRDIFRGKEHAG